MHGSGGGQSYRNGTATCRRQAGPPQKKKPSPQRQSIGNDLEAAVIVVVNDDIDVSQKDIRATVAPASRQTLAAARSSGMLRERKSRTRWQAVVAVLIKPGAAAAPGKVEGDHPKPKPSIIFAGPCPGEEALLERIVYGRRPWARLSATALARL